MSINIMLVDDHCIFRESLRSMLQSVDDFNVVAESASGRSCIDTATKVQPDMVVMDISLPDASGIEATRLIREKMPSCKVIILSMHDQRQFFTTALRAGASGYLLKDCSSLELISCIRAVAAGGTCFSPKVSNHLLSQADVPQDTPSTLSPREIDVLKMVTEGMNTKEIAFNLHKIGRAHV